MRVIALLTIIFISILFSRELKVKANNFNANEKTGISVFEGNVNVIKDSDELNASKVTIYTDKEHQPTKFVAEGNVSFYIQVLDGEIYRGKAQKVVFMPIEKEYHFYKDVHLQQIHEKKEIIGDEVVLKTIEGKAYAKGAKTDPVIMIFTMPDKEEKK